jgi:glycosyltransferase involved in cell wall biosynthesis
MKKLKIMIIPMLPTLFGRRYQLSKYLAKKNEVHLILWNMPYPVTLKNLLSNLKDSWRYKRFKKEDIIIHKIRRLPFFFPLINRWFFQKQIKIIFDNFNIDIIISESFFSETEPPPDLPIISDLNDYYEAYAEIYGSRFYKLAYKFLKVKDTVEGQVKRAKAVFAVSDILVEQAQKHNKNVYKIPNGVESWVLYKKYNRGKYNFGMHSLIYVSNFGQWSGLLDLLHVVYELKKDFKDIKLVLIGEGLQIPKVIKLIRILNLNENVKLSGSVWDRKQLFEIINSCEVCLNISQKNAYRDAASPIKVFEYSALGKKIVSTNLEEVKKLDFPNIFFYEEDEDQKNLTRTIKKALHEKIDDEKVKLKVKQYTWENITSNIEKILYQCLSEMKRI